MGTTVQGNKPMMEEGLPSANPLWRKLRVLGWSLAGLLLLLPLLAMLFTDEVDWGPEDFLFAALLLGGAGLLFEGVLRRSTNDAYRTGALMALAAIFLLIWSNAAVGLVGSGANAANILYGALVAVPLIGGGLTGFKARGLSNALLVTAALQAAITMFAFITGLAGADEGPVILAMNALFTLLWLGAAALFHYASVQQASPQDAVEAGWLPFARSPIRSVLSLLMASIGGVMLVAMVIVESEPGALPLLLVTLGITWFGHILYRSRNKGKR